MDKVSHLVGLFQFLIKTLDLFTETNELCNRKKGLLDISHSRRLPRGTNVMDIFWLIKIHGTFTKFTKGTNTGVLKKKSACPLYDLAIGVDFRFGYHVFTGVTAPPPLPRVPCVHWSNRPRYHVFTGVTAPPCPGYHVFTGVTAPPPRPGYHHHHSGLDDVSWVVGTITITAVWMMLAGVVDRDGVIVICNCNI